MRFDSDKLPIRRLPRDLSRFGRTPWQRALFFLLGLAVAFAIGRWTGPPATADRGKNVPVEVTGVAKIIDGDTIEVLGVRVRLFGIDAPEREQSCERADGSRYACGDFARGALAQAIAGSPVACSRRDVDPYGRMVAVCRGSAGDLSARLVADGAAMAYRRFSSDYVDEEEIARRSRRGIWQGQFDAPWDYRHKSRTADARRDRRTDSR